MVSVQQTFIIHDTPVIGKSCTAVIEGDADLVIDSSIGQGLLEFINGLGTVCGNQRKGKRTGFPYLGIGIETFEQDGFSHPQQSRNDSSEQDKADADIESQRNAAAQGTLMWLRHRIYTRYCGVSQYRSGTCQGCHGAF